MAPSAVVAVRFKRPSGRRTRLSRARLGKAVGVPRGADDPRRPPGRGSWGLSFSSSGHPRVVLLKFGPSSPGARARIGHLPKVVPAQQHRRAVPAHTHPTHVSAPSVVNLAVSGCASHGSFRPCAGRGCSQRSRLKTDLLHAIHGMRLPMPLLRAFGAGQSQITTARSIPLLSPHVPWFTPQTCPKAPLG
jgi:hypothetical protein